MTSFLNTFKRVFASQTTPVRMTSLVVEFYGWKT
jgi:hypothetical protein